MSQYDASVYALPRAGQSSIGSIIFSSAGEPVTYSGQKFGSSVRSKDDGIPTAGRATAAVNASFSALDYQPGKMEKQRNFLLDDYAACERSSRRNAPVQQGVKELLQFQTAEQSWQPEQGTQHTRFNKGFMRRTQQSIGQDAERKAFEESRAQRLTIPAGLRKDRLTNQQTFAYNGYNVITGEEVGDKAYTWRSGKHRVVDERNPVGADAPNGRLRDSTSRFFCTPDALPTSAARASCLVNDGLVDTRRTSTVIGIGPNRRQEISSVGVSENFNNSHYAQSRRERFASQRERAADIASVKNLPA